MGLARRVVVVDARDGRHLRAATAEEAARYYAGQRVAWMTGPVRLSATETLDEHVTCDEPREVYRHSDWW